MMTARKHALGAKIMSGLAILVASAVFPLNAAYPQQAQTSLEKSIEGLPWSPGFSIGVGVDPVTGGLAGTPFVAPTITSESKKSSTETGRYISSEEDMNQEVEASVSGKYNIQPGVTASASASYLNKVSYSESSTTLILKHLTSFGYDEAVNFEFTPNAKRIMDEAPAKFREAYGDYFVSALSVGHGSSSFTS